MSIIIAIIHRIIPTIGEHIISGEALAGTYVGIGIDESAYLGVIISGLQITEPSLGVVDVFTVDYREREGGRSPSFFGGLKFFREWIHMRERSFHNSLIRANPELILNQATAHMIMIERHIVRNNFPFFAIDDYI